MSYIPRTSVEAAMGACIPSELILWMIKFRAFVAGSAVLSYMVGSFKPNKIAIWVPNAEWHEAKLALAGMELSLVESNGCITVTAKHTFVFTPTMYSLDETLTRFDLDVCRVAWDPSRPCLVVAQHIDAIVARKATTRAPIEQKQRLKYIERGFLFVN